MTTTSEYYEKNSALFLQKDVGEGILQTDGVLVKMPPKKKPLEDARKRLQEKLSNVQEQSDFICQFINDLANKVHSKN